MQDIQPGDDPFLSALWERQRQAGMSAAELARAMGVSEATISLLKAGKHGAGGKVIRAAIRLWPELGYPLTVGAAKRMPAPVGAGEEGEPQRSPAGR